MIKTDRNALICDLAETYQVYDYKSLPCNTVAILACGLRSSSRIKMKISGTDVEPEQLLLAHIADNTRILAWQQTKDGQKGRNVPESLVGVLMGAEEENDVVVFETGQDFEDEWRRLGGKR